jgi:Protein of unknown function (DUF2971)
MFSDEFAGRYLFHYTSAETFLAHILPAMRLRMSPMNDVKDPRESKVWLPTLAMDDGPLDGMGLEELIPEFDRVMRARTKVLCFTRDDPNLNEERSAYLYGRGYAHSRMWDRYAHGHAGVCLAFDIDTLGNEIASSLDGRGLLLHQGVSYFDFPPDEVGAFTIFTSKVKSLGLEQALSEHRVIHQGTFYFYKSSDWQSEYEYRWILLSDHDDRWEYVPIEDSLAGVIFGVDYPMESIGMVRNELKTRNVVFGQMFWRNGHPIPIPMAVPE